jgi:glycosyltransferase involved in cell wall biosynthesis
MKTAAQLAPQRDEANAPGGGQVRTPGTRTLLVISADVRPELQGEMAAGRYPRKDYFELARALEADILDWPSTNDTLVSRLLARLAGKAVAQAWLAFRQRRRYAVIYTDSERVGIPLALLLKLARVRRTRHIMLSHLLSPWKKRLWFRWGHLHSHIDTIFCHSSLQRQIMLERMRIPASKIALIPYQADQHFWRPMTAEEARASMEEARANVGLSTQPAASQSPTPAGQETGAAPQPTSPSHSLSTHGEGRGEAPMICSVGLEYRDYPTLIEAVRGLDARLEIAAASYWSHHKKVSDEPSLPPNVHIGAHQYLSLRYLYAAARFVVVPLVEVPNQAGITVILEAMAMGKAVIVSATRGQTDTVRDRRNHGYGRVARAVLPGFLDAPDVPEDLKRLPTGFYVQPGDPVELRKAISYLLAHPEVAEELGRNGRRVVESLMSLDAFVERIAQVIQQGVSGG